MSTFPKVLLGLLGALFIISLLGIYQNDQVLNEVMFPGQPSKTVTLKPQFGGGTVILYTKRDYQDHPACTWVGQPECPTPTPTATATRTRTPTATASRTAIPTQPPPPPTSPPTATATRTNTRLPVVETAIKQVTQQAAAQEATVLVTALTPTRTNTPVATNTRATNTPLLPPTRTPPPTPTHEIATRCQGTYHGIKYDIVIGQKIEENTPDGFVRIVCIKDEDGGAKPETRLLTKQDLEFEQSVEGAKSLLPVAVSLPFVLLALGLGILVLIGTALFVGKEGKELIEVGELLLTFFWPVLVGLIIGVAMIYILSVVKISLSTEWNGIIIGFWIAMIYLILLGLKLGGEGGGHGGHH